MARIPFRLFCLLLPPLSLPVAAQNPALWRFWDTSDGFAESYSAGAIVDRAGNIWVKHGTTNALSRLNGFFVESLHEAYDHGRLFAGVGGDLWLFDGAGLRRYNGSAWLPYRLPESVRMPRFRPGTDENWVLADPSGEISFRLALSPTGPGRVLILLPDRLMDYDVSGRCRELKTAVQTTLRRFLDMRGNPDGNIWITGESGLLRARPKSSGGDALEWQEYTAPAGYTHLEHPLEGDGGELFVAARQSDQCVVLRRSADKWEKVFTGSNEPVRGWRGADGDLWFQNGSTLLRQSGGVLETVEREASLSGIIYDILPSRGGSFWVATTQGLARYAPALWRTPPAVRDHDMDDLVNSIVEDARGRLWFLTPRFLVGLSGTNWTRHPLPPKFKLPQSRVDNLFPLADGSVALLSSGKDHIWIFHPEQETFTPLLHPEGRHFRMFARRRQGDLFVQTTAAGDNPGYRVEIFDGRSFHPFLDRGNAWGITDLRAVVETSDGAVWFGGDAGLAVYRNGEYRKLQAKDGFPDTAAFSLFEAAPGRLLVGGRNMLVEFDGNHWNILQTGLDRVRKIIRARDGSLWLASGSGVHHLVNGAWITNGIAEGLTSAVAYQVQQDSQGRVWLGTTRGISLFHPEADTDPPITGMAEDGNPQQTAPSGEIHLMFKGVDKWKYTLPERLLFSHRVDGGEWSPFHSSASVTLRSLAAGTHHFEVRAMDRNGNVDPNGAGFDFLVPLPWYRNPGFLLIVAAGLSLIAGLLFVAVRQYRQRGRLIGELRQARAAAEMASQSAEEARQQAESSNRAKSQFLAQMSHEIRTPMNGILGITELTLDSETTPQQRENLGLIRECADSLLTILNDILDFSRIEAGKLEFERTDFRLRATLEAALKPLKLRAGWKGIRLEHDVAPDVPDRLVGDPVRLRQVVLNLAGNAVKFTEAGLIAVKAAVEHGGEREIELRFSICDTGVGVPPEKQQSIFRPFEQGDSSISRRFGGTGLGLAISTKLVQMMGGRIWLESPWAQRPESPGGPGCVFHFTVTLERQAAPEAGIEPQGDRSEETAAVTGPAGPDRPELRILVAEDNPVNQKVTAGLLKRMGHFPVLVRDGREALEVLAHDSFDLILMDVHMPRMDGFEATAAVRRTEAGTGKHIPIIAVTAHAMKGDDQRCIEGGMDAYVSKPIKVADLADAIHLVCTKKV